MIDWTSSMQQSFEYYIVNPATWKDTKQIQNVKNCTIKFDTETETLGSATISMMDLVGECYIRCYMIAIQNGVRYKIPLATVIVQTPTSTFNGKIRNVTMDAYTPLLELKEKKPLLGYSILKDANIMDNAYLITRENVRAPVVKAECTKTLFSDFVAGIEDTQLTFISDLISNAKYKFSLDEMGRILFSPKQDTASLQPVWTFDDNNSSILYPELTMDHDIYGIPNVVEVIYSNGSGQYCSRVVNDDSNSPTSTVNRGREILYRVTDPNLIGDPTEKQIDEYAKQLLQELSTVEYTISYTHAYCPVRVDDCVRLNYSKAGLDGVKARVISQTIRCEPGCPVDEKAVFPMKLWK